MMVIPRFTLRATALAMACLAGAEPGPGSNMLGAHAISHSVDQDDRKASATNPTHRYKRSSRWITCGAIEYPGYDGCIGASGNVWKCHHGATVQVVKEGCTSSRAAEAKRLARLEAKDMAAKPWRIEQTETLDEATIVELAEPVSFHGVSSKWVIMWVRDNSLFLIYGPDREHVMDVYQTCQGCDLMKYR
jgi:hypothetical protein